MMKRLNKIIFYIFILTFFSGCPGNRQENYELNTPENVQASPAPTPIPTPVNNNQIGSYTTNLYDKNENRISNISTAAEDLNHTVLEPGEIFSFNETLGRRTEEKGYEEAPIMVQGKKDTGTGGGICQISSTLYNAALSADMKIVERHRHSKAVPYVPEGKDATVVYGSKDLKFKNIKDYPVEILIWVNEDDIKITLNKKTD